MEDDLFLDDEAEETEPKPKSKSKSKGGSKAKKPSASEKATASQDSEKVLPKEPKAAKTPPAPRDESQSISLMAASIIVISAFVAGLAIGGLIFSSSQPETAPVQAPSQSIAPGGGMPGGGQQAPPLSQQQQQQGLPKGHPTVPSQSGTATKSPSK